jgi:hypothetical protein
MYEDALLALRNVNNNPTSFTSERRPIVEFSIENRKALLARQKRMEKSREKNPNSKDIKFENKKLETKNNSKAENLEKAGAELCQAQDKLGRAKVALAIKKLRSFSLH